MKETCNLSQEFSVAPEVIYNAWLNSDEHSKMTGGGADCSDNIGDAFTAWDDYISGINISLTPFTEIRQSWRTTEFSNDDEDSDLLIRLTATPKGCELHLIHTNIPEGQTQYEQGWINHYFTPMKEYFG